MTDMVYINAMKHMSVKLSEDLHDAFKKYAKSQRRPMSEQIVWMIEEAVKNEDKKPPECSEG